MIRKKKQQIFIKTIIFIFLLSIFTQSCKEDEIVDKHNIQVKHLSINQIQQKKFYKSVKKIETNFKSYLFNQNKSSFNDTFNIKTDLIFETTLDSITTYSFLIERTPLDESLTENLLVSVNNNTEVTSYRILQINTIDNNLHIYNIDENLSYLLNKQIAYYYGFPIEVPDCTLIIYDPCNGIGTADGHAATDNCNGSHTTLDFSYCNDETPEPLDFILEGEGGSGATDDGYIAGGANIQPNPTPIQATTIVPKTNYKKAIHTFLTINNFNENSPESIWIDDNPFFADIFGQAIIAYPNNPETAIDILHYLMQHDGFPYNGINFQEIFDFIEENNNTSQIITETAMRVELITKSDSDWDYSQTGTFRNRTALQYIAKSNPNNSSGTYYKLQNGAVLFESPSPKIINPEDAYVLASTEIPEDDNYYYVYDYNTERWYEYILPPENYNCLSCDVETIMVAAAVNGGKLLGRYVFPIEDVLILTTGKDFDGVSQSRAVAGLFLLADIIPGTALIKGIKLVKYGDEAIDIAQAIIKYADDIFKTQKQNIKNVLNGIIDLEELGNTIRKSNFGEMVTDTDLYSKGYEPLHVRRTNIDQSIDHGIDGIFQNPQTGEYIIVESKYNTSSLGNTIDGRQMSDDWILGTTTGNNRIIGEVGEEIGNDIIDAGYTRVLSKVQPDGTIIYKELDEFGYSTGSWTP